VTTMPLVAEEQALHVDLETHAAPHAAVHEEEHDRAGINRMGLWLFMASESMLFVAMSAARFYLNGFDKGEVNLPLGIVMTFVLLASSWLGYRATGAISNGDRGRAMRSLLLACALGVLFIGGVGVEWSTASFGAALTPPVSAQSTAFGTAFYAMTGLHVFHLMTGLAGLLLVANLLRKGQFGPDDHWGVTAVVRYWTFVDVMWLVIVFPVLYLL
jgi:heme/copper-type cytochrome/quinol oxidase subunit 3